MVPRSSELSCGTSHSPAPSSAKRRLAMVAGSRLNVLQNEALAPTTTTPSSSRSSGALDDSTRAMARLVTVSFGSGVGSTIFVLHGSLDHLHNVIGLEWLLNQRMPGHPYLDLTGTSRDKEDRYRLVGTNRPNRCDSAARP